MKNNNFLSNDDSKVLFRCKLKNYLSYYKIFSLCSSDI